jgi:glycosyltransferase involved in cell wall biosynthesis
MPKVSVIMPVYNGEVYLEKSINTLLSQSFNDWELVVVDDGSTDTTPLILQRFTDPRIRTFRQKNGGEARARNTGLANVTGEYLAFLDADDEYLPDALKNLVSYLDNNPEFSVVFSDGYICDSKGKDLMRLTEIRPWIFTGNILNQLILTPTVLTVPVCTMSRLSSIREYSLGFDEKNNLYGTDWDFWIRLAAHVNFGYLDKLTCRYRIHETNISRTYGSDKRRRDYIYCRMKILQSEWFNDLSSATKEQFFLDLLTNALSGDWQEQKNILEHRNFLLLPAVTRSFLWRSTGIDILQNKRDIDLVQLCLQESLRIKPDDRKTLLLKSVLDFGRPAALMFVKLWRFLGQVKSRLNVSGRSQKRRLQKMLGVS